MESTKLGSRPVRQGSHNSLQCGGGDALHAYLGKSSLAIQAIGFGQAIFGMDRSDLLD